MKRKTLMKALLALFFIAGCSNTTVDRSRPTVDASRAKTAAAGHTLTISDMAYTIESWSYGKDIDNVTVEEGNTVLIVKVKIENLHTGLSEYNDSYNLEYWRCEVNGNYYEPDPVLLDEDRNYINDLLDDEMFLRPKESVVGYTAFEIPEGFSATLEILGNDYDASVDGVAAISFEIPNGF